MQVLVGGDAGEQLLGERVLRVDAGVAVADPGRELLEADVRDHFELRLGDAVRAATVVGLLELAHPPALELDGIDPAGDQQEVAHAERVPAFLGRPAVGPGAPGAVASERGGDLPVVARQVVLGQQVDLEGDLGDRRERRLAGLPRLVDEVAGPAPRHVLVRHPFLGEAQVAFERGLSSGLELAKQVQAFSHDPIVLHPRSQNYGVTGQIRPLNSPQGDKGQGQGPGGQGPGRQGPACQGKVERSVAGGPKGRKIRTDGPPIACRYTSVAPRPSEPKPS